MSDANDLNRSIGQRIRKYRKDNGMTQDDLGEKLGVKRATVSAWEVGTSTIDVTILSKLSLLFNVNPNKILDVKKENEYFTNFCTAFDSSEDDAKKQAILAFSTMLLERDYGKYVIDVISDIMPGALHIMDSLKDEVSYEGTAKVLQEEMIKLMGITPSSVNESFVRFLAVYDSCEAWDQCTYRNIIDLLADAGKSPETLNFICELIKVTLSQCQEFKRSYKE